LSVKSEALKIGPKKLFLLNQLTAVAMRCMFFIWSLKKTKSLGLGRKRRSLHWWYIQLWC